MKKILARRCTAAGCVGLICGCDDKDGGWELIGPETEYVRSEARTPQPVYAVSYDIIGGKDVMPIGGWWGPYTPSDSGVNGQRLPDYVTDEYFTLIRDCGINVITATPDEYASNVESVERALQLAEKYRMGYYVNDGFLGDANNIDSFEERLALYYDSPACIGVHVADEPKTERFDTLGSVYSAYDRLGISDKHLYTNLFPNYAGDLTGTGERISYEEYVETFLQKVNTPFLTYDYYVFNAAGEGNKNALKYFSNLSLARRMANQYEIPFWVFVQAGGQWNDDGVGLESVEIYPSEGEMLWNINSSLAYGAKAIQYFTIIQPEKFSFVSDDERDFERNGLIGAAGNINRWYYYAQKANRQIAAVDHVLMNSANMGVIGVGEVADRCITGEERIDTFRELVSVEGKEVLVGCFDFFGKTALYVGNNATTDKQEIKLSFKDKCGYEVIQRAQTAEIAGKNITLKMEAGEGVLVVLK